MSVLAHLLETHSEAVSREWAACVRGPQGTSPARTTYVEAQLREVVATLRAGVTRESTAAREHGRHQANLGAPLDAAVREHGLLLDAILAVAETENIPTELAEIRLVHQQLARGVDAILAAYAGRDGPARREDGAVAGPIARASESELRDVLDALPSLVSFVTREGRYGLVNRAYEEWFGAEAVALQGRTVREVIGEDAWEKLGGFVERGLSGERFAFEQYDVSYRGAGIRDVSVSFIPSLDPSGAPSGYVALVTDITARRQHEKERDRLLAAEREALRDADVQRARLQTLVANAPIGIATFCGPEHVFDSANALYLDLLQRSPDVLGLPIRTAFSDMAQNHDHFEIWDRVFRTGTPHVDTAYRVTLVIDGQPRERVYLFHLVATRDADGVIDGTMASYSDLTEEHRLRELVEIERDLANALANHEADSRAAAEKANATSTFLLDVANALGSSLEADVILQRLVAAVAPAHAMLAGAWTKAEDGSLRRVLQVPRARPAILGPDTPPLSERGRGLSLPVEQVYAERRSLRMDDYEQWMIAAGHPDLGRLAPASGIGPCLFVPLLRAGDVAAVLAVGRREGAPFSDGDVAMFESLARVASIALENARLYAEMARLRQTAEESTRSKDRFLANVSHDLRNPLGSILGWTSLLRSLPEPPAQLRRGLDVIERNAKAQVQLIEDLLDVTRIAEGKLALAVEVENVREAIDSALDAARLAATAKHIALEITIEPEIGAIAVDPDRFRQIIWNLVSNAVKFTPPHGRVRVGAARREGVVEIVVEDTGRGISADFLPRVFSALEQAEEGQSRAAGLGLGLAIVKQLVELHHGSVRVESEGEGAGARFVVRLPIRAAVVKRTDGDGALGGLHVLVVDDEDDARDIVTSILELAGACVTAASSVEDALDAVMRAPPDAIVSDVSMPGQSGIDLVRAIRSLPAGDVGKVPVIALTALIGRRDRLEVLDAGFDAHLGKPIESDRLIAQLAELVGRARAGKLGTADGGR